jgi:hypothetical protein
MLATTGFFYLHHDIILLFDFFVAIFILFFAFIDFMHGIFYSVKVFSQFVVLSFYDFDFVFQQSMFVLY